MSDHMREQFEDMMSSQGEWPQAIEQYLTGGYKLATTATAWEVWQSAWEAGHEMMKSRLKELEAINLGLTKTLLEEGAEKAKLVEALEPFAACADELDGYPADGVEPSDDNEWASFRLLVSDYRRARTALAAYRKQEARHITPTNPRHGRY